MAVCKPAAALLAHLLNRRNELTMIGTHEITGQALDGDALLAQMIRDVLKTPVGSRVLNRDYGSRLFELVDAPASPALEVDVFAETAQALNRWLVDADGNALIRIDRVQIASRERGKLLLDLFATDLSTGEIKILEGVSIT